LLVGDRCCSFGLVAVIFVKSVELHNTICSVDNSHCDWSRHVAVLILVEEINEYLIYKVRNSIKKV
jgi:hypothetical protein